MTNTLRTRYPHLLPEDNQLWNDYQIFHEPAFDTFLYDVAVGLPRDPGAEFPDNIRAMAMRLSRRRLDVVAINASGIMIFEITQSAGLRAVGQAMVYPHLLRTTWQTTVPIAVTIVTRTIEPNIHSALSEFNILVVVVPFIPTSLEPPQ